MRRARAGVTQWGAVAFCLLLLQGCSSEPARLQERVKPLAGQDELTPQEPRPERERVFGFDVPLGVQVVARFPGRAQLTSRLPIAELSAAIKKQVQAERAQLEGSGLVFPQAVFPSDPQRRIYRIELTATNGRTLITITDQTPSPVTEGIDSNTRWERAGRNPDGSLKDRLKVF